LYHTRYPRFSPHDLRRRRPSTLIASLSWQLSATSKLMSPLGCGVQKHCFRHDGAARGQSEEHRKAACNSYRCAGAGCRADAPSAINVTWETQNHVAANNPSSIFHDLAHILSAEESNCSSERRLDSTPRPNSEERREARPSAPTHRQRRVFPTATRQ
jgi:hypothetical protein